MTNCRGCNADTTGQKFHVCESAKPKPHDCKKDGHSGKRGLITMFVCKYCGFTEPLANELIPSENELAMYSGYNGSSYEDDY